MSLEKIGELLNTLSIQTRYWNNNKGSISFEVGHTYMLLVSELVNYGQEVYVTGQEMIGEVRMKPQPTSELDNALCSTCFCIFKAIKRSLTFNININEGYLKYLKID